MKYILLVIFLLHTQVLLSVASNECDSMLQTWAKLPPDDRMANLNKFANMSNGETYKWYADHLLEEARRERSDIYIGNALFQIVRYYYARNIDSMCFFLQQAEPIFLKQNRYEELFRMKAWYIYALSNNGETDIVLVAVEQLKKLSDKLNFPDGIDMANQALADFYISINLHKEGIALYEEVLGEMEKRNAPLGKRITIIRHLLNKGIGQSRKLFYLNKLKGHIDECVKKGIKRLDEQNDLYYVQFLYHRSYALFGLDTKDPVAAEFHLVQAEKLADEYNMKNEYLSLTNTRLLYYMMMGNSEKAIALADELIGYCLQRKNVTWALNIMKDKARIYYNAGRGMESANTYRDYVALKDSISNEGFYEDLAKLRTRHDMDKLELANKKMELEVAHSRVNLLMMGGGLAFLVLLCCSLGYISYSRHRYGQQLEKAKEKAEEADRLKSAFLANMNHEIRTPLNAIVGFSQVLVEENDPVVRQEYADIIANNNELLQRLVCDVLDISKVESNTMEFTYSDVDMPAMMKEIYSVMSLRIPEGVELRLDSCPAFIFHTDRNRLTQILTNFLTNASKHTEKGYICFGYEFIETGQVRFYVKDSGEGIPEEQLDRIFTRFVKLTEWTKGVGLGLAISKALVTHLGGHIEVESKVGVGSTFSVIFPINK